MSSPAIVLPPGVPVPNIDHMLGVILVCLIIAAYFFGMSSSQAYIYYDRFPKDPWTFKTLVAVTWALDTLHTALMSHTVYYYTVTHFGDYLALTTKPTWSFNLEILIVPIIALIVQWFFAYRAYSIDRNNWPLALTIATLAVIQLGFGIASSVFSFTQVKGFYDIRRFDWSSITWLATGATANILVCVSLVWTFYTSKTTFNEDDGWMTRILMYGVHTGAFTTLTTIIDVIFIASWKGTLVSTGLNYSASISIAIRSHYH
ncbi:hypothetical protein BS47DRAFT_1115866 [Hydnum rufescens UP504]|uniref:Uncharacterized protein n=1 Tax=Hydnum rufescens UP504 TaxID=1448309 RepID=A0A9P6AU70_9AGAM|nr:hypothetical protein BS47DRAFT_1115866 [Hydnum rufescens UP504]